MTTPPTNPPADQRPADMGVRQFARLLGRSPGYVSQLKREGRLITTADGKRILVEPSIARIADTASPDKAPVAERWAAHRQQRDAAAPADNSGAPPSPAAAPASAPDIGPNVAGGYQAARALKERYNALTAKAEYEQLIGKLCDAEAVSRAGADIGATIRSQHEALADRLAPEVAAETDPDAAHRLLSDAFDHLLRDLSRLLKQAAEHASQRADAA